MTNLIESFEGNSVSFTCTVEGLENLTGYAATLSVYDKHENLQFEKDGVIVGLTIAFDVLNTDNALTFDDYIYEITITDGTNYFTLVRDTWRVKKSDKF
jgi:hypothetical protein